MSRKASLLRAGSLLWLIILTSLITGLFPLSRAFADTRGPVTLVIMHTNDIHGHLTPHIYKNISTTRLVGGMANIASMVGEIRRAHPEATLLLDAGDIAQGTPVSNIFRGIPVVEVMNRMKYDAVVLGNHEFDWGMEPLEKMIRSARFPVLSANVLTRDRASQGRRSLINGVKPYIIKDVAGISVGILGITTVTTPHITSRDKVAGLVFRSAISTAREYVPRMKQEGAEIIVVLSHQGYSADLKLAGEVPEIDVVVGGHGHSIIKTPGKAGNALVVQAGSYGRYLGKLTLKVNPATGKVIHDRSTYELITVFDDKHEPDRETAEIIEKYESKIREKMSRQINTSPVDLTRSRGKSWSDSMLGNAICDSYLKATGAQVSIYNPGGIRSDIYRGPVNLEHIYKTLPFDDQLITMDIPGQGIMKVLEHGARYRGSPQVGGITYEVDYRRPRGNRVANVKIGGVPLNPRDTYTLTTVDFLYNGGDRFKFPGAVNIRRGPYSRDVFIDYFKEVKDFNQFRQGRIRIIDSKD